MNVRTSILILLGIVAAHTGSSSTPGPGPVPFTVTAEWLDQHLHDPGIVLLHIGERAGFDEAHIPGAQYLSLSEISTPRGGPLSLELPSLSMLDSTFERKGVSDNSRIIVYFGKDWVTPTARVYFTLDYLGMGDRASILDGGLPAWQARGFPTSTDSTTPHPGSFTPHPNPAFVADAQWLRDNLQSPSLTLIDTRNTEYYTGEKQGTGSRAGHIPGARNIPFDQMLDSTYALKDIASLRKLFVDAGATPEKTVVTYCHIGQQASLGYVIARMLGYDAKLYDGSFQDWSRHEEWPVVSTAKSDEK